MENQGVEPCDPISRIYGLAIRCITVLPVLHIETHSNTNVLQYGGRGETRTHTPIAEPSVFKTAAAMPIRLTLPLVGDTGFEPVNGGFKIHCLRPNLANPL